MSEELPSGERVPPHSKWEHRLAKNFRWQAFFQRCADPVFVLDRRRRLLFVNPAWEALTGVPAAQAHDVVCRRPRPVTVDDSAENILAHALTPPPEVLQGAGGRVRRELPDRTGGRRWWDVEFLPLRQEGKQGGHFIVGRIRPVPAVEPAAATALPEKLVNLRQRRVERYSLDLWASPLPAMRRLVEQVRLASQVTTPVLLIGEPGTGKETLARTIHHLSPSREGACAVLDCDHLPPTAVAALLFGERVSGRDQLAAVYLREPGRLPHDLQLRLCEWLARDAEGPARPRLLAGNTLAPARAVRAGLMLDELACALGTLVLEVPPLRERRDDLPGLVERLLERACADRETRITSLSADAWAVVRGYAWPYNVGELYTVLRDACGRATGGQLRAADLPAELCRAVEREEVPPRPADRALPLEQLLEEAERRLIQLALRRAGGHKARAARLLSIPRPRLWRRMVKLGIADTEEGVDLSGEEAQDEE
jgi:transcriptional regulator with PAS, ATPase and Fis domain